MKTRFRTGEVELTILEALSEGEPYWRRGWVSERALLDEVRDRSSLDKALQRLARRPDILLRGQTTAHGRFWLLARGSADSDVVRSDSLIEDDRPRPRAIGGRSPPVPAEEPMELDGPPVAEPVGAEPVFRREQAVDERKEKPGIPDLQRALEDVGIRVASVGPNPQIGPTVIQHQVVLAPGERIEQVRRRAEDLSRELGRPVFVSQLPGHRYILVDLARPDRQTVSLLPALKSEERPCPAHGLWILVGVTPGGLPWWLDLATVPHLLIAGSPGTGKTVWLQTALLSLSMGLDPSQLELIIIDAKRLDFLPFARLPHLRFGRVIEEPEEAIEVLRSVADAELSDRTRLLQEVGCPNFRELRERHPERPAKNLVIVIDELAELVTVLPKQERFEFEREILRLAQRARAVGIHLVVATQRPSTEFITGAVKANLPTRIAFRLPQRIDSAVIIDQPGAESLLGAGDLLVLHEGRLQRLQGYFVSTAEIVETVERLSNVPGGRK
jgi:DNA segregation ATPase FtsK/SpoIIIE-like protein